MNQTLEKLCSSGIVPVIRLERAADALPLGKALIEGGLPVAEVTFRTAAAASAIRLLRKNCPALTVGAGTVLTVEQVDEAVDAGAGFIVTPGFNPRVVDHCIGRGVPVMPGVNSPTQVEMGLERGLALLKFFPAEASGGVKMLRALHGPYGDVLFVPTGGVDAANLAAYLSLPNVAACGGTWMVKEDLIASGRFGEVARLCTEAVAIAEKARS